MRVLLIATKNSHKTAEIRDVLGPGWELSDLSGHPEIPAPDETGDSFEANARIKATEISRRFPGLVLSDDSGLEVDALGGAPGVHSARFAGYHGDDAANRTRLKSALLASGAPQPWTARFRCAMALAKEGVTVHVSEGTVEGIIIPEERGHLGFGYDSLFVPAGFDQSFGQLSSDVKNSLSHRARALSVMLGFLSAFR